MNLYIYYYRIIFVFAFWSTFSYCPIIPGPLFQIIESVLFSECFQHQWWLAEIGCCDHFIIDSTQCFDCIWTVVHIFVFFLHFWFEFSVSICNFNNISLSFYKLDVHARLNRYLIHNHPYVTIDTQHTLKPSTLLWLTKYCVIWYIIYSIYTVLISQIIKYEPYDMANMIYSIYYGGNYIPVDKMAPLYNFIWLSFVQKRFLSVLSAEMLLEKIVFSFSNSH